MGIEPISGTTICGTGQQQVEVASAFVTAAANSLAADNYSDTITLTVDNQVSTTAVSLEVINNPPSGSITSPTGNVTIEVGDSVSFAGEGSDPEDHLPLTYAWDFGGGAPNSSAQSPGAVTFNTPGVFTVTFTVTDSTGLSDLEPPTRQITVISPLQITIDSPPDDVVEIGVGGTVDFAATASGGVAPYTYSWSFAGGTPSSSTAEDPGTVTYNTAGEFAATVTVTDAQGNTASEGRTVIVRPELQVTIDQPPDEVVEIGVGGTVDFAATASGGVAPYTYSWSFPGGTPSSSTAEDPGTVTYNTAGEFTATVTVTDAQGNTASEGRTVIVTQELRVIIDQPPDEVVEIGVGGTVDFAATASGGMAPYTYSWSFPGGTPSSSTAEDPGTVTYNTVGEFTATVTVTDAQGSTASEARTVTVTPELQVTIDQPPDNVTIGVGGTVDFAATASGGMAPYTYSWSFAGGTPSSSTAEDPGTVTYNTAGEFTATVTVTDAESNTASEERIVTVTAAPITADLSLSKTASADVVELGDALSYTLTVTNNGPSSATAVTVTDELPAGFDLESVSSSQGNCSGLPCSLGTLNQGQNATVTVTGTVAADAADTLTNNAAVTAAEEDPNPSNNRTSVSVSVSRAQEVTVSPLSSMQTLQASEAQSNQVVTEEVTVSGGRLPYQLQVSGAEECFVSQETLNESPGTVEFGVRFGTELPQTGAEFNCELEVSDTDGQMTTARFQLEVSEPTQEEIDTALQNIATTPNQRETGRVIGTVCPQLGEKQQESGLTASEAALKRDCDALIGGALNQNDVSQRESAAALAQITLDQGRQPVNASYTSIGVQAYNVGLRLAALRGGATGIGLAGLNLNIDGHTVAAEDMLRLANGLLGQGGAASADSIGDFGRLGVFVNGTITTGDRDTTTDEVGFDFDTWGITAGVDYRFTDQFVLGAAFNYVDVDSDLRKKDGDLDMDGWGIALYGSYYLSERFYLDGILNYGWNDFDQVRNLRYTLPGSSIVPTGTNVDQNLKADYDGNVFSASIGGGYDFTRGGFTFGPEARLQYVYADVDSYREKASNPSAAGSGWVMSIDDQDYTSFSIGLGGQVTYAWSRSWGVLLPQARFEWVHEFDTDNDSVDGEFIGDFTGTAFNLSVDDDDENYFNLGLGVSAVFAKGRSAYFYYQKLLGHDDLDHDAFNLGLRFEF